MVTNTLSLDEALALLAPAQKRKEELTEEQRLRAKYAPDFFDLSGKYITWHDTWPPNKRLKCLSRGCGVNTPYKVQGMPKCSIHALIALAVLLDHKDERNLDIMATAVAVTPQAPMVGDEITIAATGFANSHAITLGIIAPDGVASFAEAGTTSGGGALTWTDVASFEGPGIAQITVNDGVAPAVVVELEVFA